jgi:hypothetical protein
VSDVVQRLVGDDPNDDDTWAGTAVVTNAAAGSTSDGRKLITVLWRTTSVNCTYLASYTPVNGHNVSFIKNGPNMFVLGKPATI